MRHSNTDPRYAALAVEELARVSGQPVVLATNLVEATSDMGAFVLVSGLLKRTALKLSKICNDLRLLSSGPRTGLGEIRLPVVQAGSSIMPGKVNPVIPEVVNQVAYLVIAHHLTVALCAEGGQLQLNAFEPTIGYCILQSMRMLTAALDTLTKRCVVGIEADQQRCRRLVVESIGIVTAVSFANAGQVSPGYSSPWAAPGIPLKALKWLFMRHRPLFVWPTPTLPSTRWARPTCGLPTAQGIDPALMHRVTLDSLPHNGAVVSLLAVCSSTHGKSYFDILMVAIVGALLALVAVIFLGTVFGSF
jgi:hypothetical protein